MTEVQTVPGPAVNRPSLVDGAEKALRNWLAPGRYRQGDRLPPEHEVAAMFGVSRGTLRGALQRLTAFTERTIIDPARLAQEVAAVRERGYGEAVGEREPDLAAVAVPVLGRAGELVGSSGSRSDRAAAGRHPAFGARAVAERRRCAEPLVGRLAGAETPDNGTLSGDESMGPADSG